VSGPGKPIIRGEFIGDRRCVVHGRVITAYAPALAVCRELLAAGCDPDSVLEVYRRGVLALRLRSIAAGAALTVEDGPTGKPRKERKIREGRPCSGCPQSGGGVMRDRGKIDKWLPSTRAPLWCSCAGVKPSCECTQSTAPDGFSATVRLQMTGPRELSRALTLSLPMPTIRRLCSKLPPRPCLTV
jgi:hypothetical protein